MSNYTHLLFEQEGAVAKITLNRPDVLNSFNQLMAKETQEALQKCADDPGIRAVYLTGAGRAFCAGQDLEEAIDPNNAIDEIVRNSYNPMIRAIRAIEKPVVCAVNGVAAGAGANLAFSCDITFACESAKFIQSFSNIGLIPDSGGTYFLPRLVGMQKATAMAMLAEKIPASEAASLGLIYRSCADDQLYETAFGIAAKLAEMPTMGLGLTKRGFNEGWKNDLDTQLDLEEELQKAAGSSKDYKEGVDAFLEKRKPVFKGE
jgi:2-(1,2-epoxy-1,2-dihydrophenyl)acetyl-CoA isomerase